VLLAILRETASRGPSALALVPAILCLCLFLLSDSLIVVVEIRTNEPV